MSTGGMAAISQLPRLQALRLQLGPPSAQVPRHAPLRTHGCRHAGTRWRPGLRPAQMEARNQLWRCLP